MNSFSSILGGCLAAFLLGYGLGFVIAALRRILNVASNLE